MKKILLDTNIILDFFLERTPFIKDAEKILKLAFNKKITAYITSTSVTDIFYIAKKKLGKEETLTLLIELLTFIDIANVNKEIILNALRSKLTDFEDAVQDNSAKYNNINLIITRDKKDYKNAISTIITPEDFLKQLKSG